MRKLTVVFFDAGGGHRNAAEALRGVLQSHSRPWEVDLLNLQELLDSIDVIRKATGLRIQDGYNLILRRGWTRPTPQLLVLLRGLIRLYHKRVVAALVEHWQRRRPDMVLSVIPLFNRALAESIGVASPGTAFATLLTDMADFPPHFWMEEESEFVICGTERAEEQALSMGHPRSRVFRTSGMVLKPGFYETPRIDVAGERARIGLDRSLPTGIVTFGGHGSPVMLELAKRVNESQNQVQLIMICGHNQKLRTELAQIKSRIPMLVEGFTSNVAYYMSLADFFIGKPGPGSISEALQFHLPVIIERNGKTMPQERYNTEWVEERRLGIVLRSFHDIARGVEELLNEQTLAELCANANAYTNQALFEVPAILEEAMERHVPHSVTESSSLTGVHPLESDTAWASLT
jgi:1,2-diacylglycerol 3-beta-galactosyltransferase